MASVQTLAPQILLVTAGTTATQIALGSQASPVIAWELQNQGTTTVYIGGSAVTATAGQGRQLVAAAAYNPDLHQKMTPQQPYGLDNYWVVTTATANVCVLTYHKWITP